MSDTLAVAGGRVVDVRARRIRPADVLIENGVIAAVGEGIAAGAADTIDARGRLVTPGLIDPHLHIESSLLTPLEFARASVPLGTTAVFVDPHEIANVCGIPGVELFLDQAAEAALQIHVGVPSCVPATSLEPAGAALGVAEIRRLLGRQRVYGLAEMMDFPGVIHGRGEARDKVDLVVGSGGIVDGHCPGLAGDDLLRYVSNGRDDGVVRIMSDHECSGADEAIEKHRAGVTIAMRYSRLTQDLDRILPGILERLGGVPERFMLCSDDLEPLELAEDGHMNRTVRRARALLVEHGSLDFETATATAFALATLEPARYFSRYFDASGAPGAGELAPGRRGDLVVFDSIEALRPETVVCGGSVVSREGRVVTGECAWSYGGLVETVRVGRRLETGDFRVPAPNRGAADVRVIRAVAGQLGTERDSALLEPADGELAADPGRDLLKVAVIERHRGTGEIGRGFVRGLGVRRGAIASTVAHDSHNLVVAGVDDESMALAANRLVELGGGLCVALGGRVTELPLPVAGLMSTEPIETLTQGYRKLLAALRETGTAHENAFMMLSFLPLPVIPQLRITSRGLVDVDRFEVVSLIAT